MMYHSVHEQFEIFSCTIEIEVDNKIQRQHVREPRMMLEQHFSSLIQQAAHTSSPVKIKMSRIVPIYDNFNDNWIQRELSVSFKNNAYIKIKGEDL